MYVCTVCIRKCMVEFKRDIPPRFVCPIPICHSGMDSAIVLHTHTSHIFSAMLLLSRLRVTLALMSAP